MQTNLVTISDKWQMVIPKSVRKILKVRRGDKVLVSSAGPTRITVDVIGKDAVKNAFGALKKYDKDGKLFERLLAQKRSDLAYEDRER